MTLQESLVRCKDASRASAQLSADQINATLTRLAAILRASHAPILAANQRDLAEMERNNPLYDRLLLNVSRLDEIADSIDQLVQLPCPQGELLTENVRPNGLRIEKRRVPFGVIAVIYEARPNVSLDVFSLCFKSGNTCVLKGGSDAYQTNACLVALIRDVLQQQGLSPEMVQLLPPGRESTQELLHAVGLIDLLIPRGSQSLINYVREQARVPVIETGAGICHCYVDAAADSSVAGRVVTNAKTRRVSVCNALDCLLIHHTQLANLPSICSGLIAHELRLHADEHALDALAGAYPRHLVERADEASYGREFLDYQLSIRTVWDVEEAIAHITRYSSQHSEAIITEDAAIAQYFTRCIDAACVYVNASTAFTDGAQFGFGAEIGISTQKMHARGPMALNELTSYKYVIYGEGQIRP